EHIARGRAGQLGCDICGEGSSKRGHRPRKLHPDRMIRRIIRQPDRTAIADIRGRIVQEETYHLRRCEVLDDAANPGRGASVQERGCRWSKSVLVSLFFNVASDREVVAQNTDAANRRSGSTCECLGRIVAARYLGKQVKFDSSLDRGGLLEGEDSINEQIR